MAVQILSDLHLAARKAYDISKVVPKAPYLALPGDIGDTAWHKDNCLNFLTQQLHHFGAVLFVPANNEAYHSNWPKNLEILRAFEVDICKNRLRGDFILLDRATFWLPGTVTEILGCSLFSSVLRKFQIAVSLGLGGFFHISDWDVNMHNEAYKRHLAWLNAQVADLE